MVSSIQDIAVKPEYDYLFKRPSWPLNFLKYLFEYYCRTVLSIYCPLTVYGRENIPEESFMFCSNHNSHMDVTILMSTSKEHFNQYSMIAAKDYWFDDKFKKFLTSIILTLIPIERARAGDRKLSIMETVDLSRKFLAEGNRKLIYFPEGTRSLTGEMGRFKKGAAAFAINLGLPVVPVHIKGTYAAWPKGRIFMKPTRITAMIGEPIYHDKSFGAAAYDGLDAKEAEDRAVAAMTQDIEDAIRRLGEVEHG